MPKRRFFRGSNGLLGAATARPYLIADCSTYDCNSRRRASKTRAFTARDARRHWLCLRGGVLGFQPRGRLVAGLGSGPVGKDFFWPSLGWSRARLGCPEARPALGTPRASFFFVL